MNDNEAAFLEVMRSRLNGDEDAAEVDRQAFAAGGILGLPEDSIRVVIQALKREDQDEEPGVSAPPVEQLATSSTITPPRLRVDWGQDLCVGHQACPEFTLLGGDADAPKPHLQVKIDPRLDHDQAVRDRNLVPDGRGGWRFDVPFALTSHGEDCRPGRYRIEVLVAARSDDQSLPSCYVCTIRLNVGGSDSAGGPTLEIEGDGQSVVNLQGGDLNRFATVKLKGGDTSVVNFQSAATQDSEEPSTVDPSDSDVRICEYQFAVDQHRQSLLPLASAKFQEHYHLKSAALVFESGRRVLLVAKARVNLGRAKTSDIVTRFLPRSEANDKRTRDISRRHFALELTADGLLVSDLGSTKGVALDGFPIDGSRLLKADDVDEEVELHTSSSPSGETFGFRLRSFGPDDDGESDRQWHDFVCCNTLQCREPKLWRTARMSHIDAVRITRTRNLAELEQYVLIAREALVGFSEDAPIYLADPSVHRSHARIVPVADGFWLENLSPSEDTLINDHPVGQREFVPLVPGMRLTFANVQCRFEEFRQIHVDA